MAVGLKEIMLLRDELQCVKFFSIIYDGTTDIGELFNVVLRFVDAAGNCQQRLIELKTYESSFKAKGLTRAIVAALAQHSLVLQDAVGMICDGASTNLASHEMLSVLTDALPMVCVSHGLSNIGKNVSTFSHTRKITLTLTCSLTYSLLPPPPSPPPHLSLSVERC